MPFVSEKQKGWLWHNKPKIAKRWTKKYGADVVGKLIKHKRKKKK
ncbi:unnamed protein product [marine sediment metagenome]|uniref:Uncharacterized protein n=1 Tax=marine sediment metagenome TaxID=412755 RepID=X0WSV3_9ZZZZ